MGWIVFKDACVRFRLSQKEQVVDLNGINNNDVINVQLQNLLFLFIYLFHFQVSDCSLVSNHEGIAYSTNLVSKLHLFCLNKSSPCFLSTL